MFIFKIEIVENTNHLGFNIDNIDIESLKLELPDRKVINSVERDGDKEMKIYWCYGSIDSYGFNS